MAKDTRPISLANNIFCANIRPWFGRTEARLSKGAGPIAMNGPQTRHAGK